MKKNEQLLTKEEEEEILFRKPEHFRKLLTKEEEEEIQEDVQRDSRVVKD